MTPLTVLPVASIYQVLIPVTVKTRPNGPVQVFQPVVAPLIVPSLRLSRPDPTVTVPFALAEAQFNVVPPVVSLNVTCGDAPVVVAVYGTTVPAGADPAVALKLPVANATAEPIASADKAIADTTTALLTFFEILIILTLSL